jgi:ABC-type transport system involved in multi-copper enzyme maturation permease subunit
MRSVAGKLLSRSHRAASAGTSLAICTMATLAKALSAIFVALFPLIILTGKKVFANVPPPMPGSITFYEFPTVWDYQGYVGNWFVSFCLGFMMVYMITSEVSNRTQRQSIINGLTRKEYWLSKITVLVSLSVVATLIYVISSLLLGIIHTDGYTNVRSFLYFIGSYSHRWL